jgi:hypothetical protein
MMACTLSPSMRPLQQIDLLRLARQDVDQRQAVAVAVLQVLQGLVEHHADMRRLP